MKNNKTIEKIQKLLETTVDNGASAEESQSAIAMAQRLMAKHKIEMRDVEMAGDLGKVDPIEMDVVKGKSLSWWTKQLALAITENFRCAVYINNAGSTRSIRFIGEPEDAEIASKVFEFALGQMEYYAKQYRRKRRKAHKDEYGDTTHFDGIAIRNDYMLGYISGLEDKLKEQLNENSEYALIIQTPNSVVEALDKLNLRTSRVSTRGAGDAHAKASGYEQGKKFNSPTKVLS